MNPEEYKKLPYDKEKVFKERTTTVFRKEVSYDINSLPFFIADTPENYKNCVDSIVDIYTKSGVILYDSSRGHAPVFTEKDLKR